MSELSVKWRAKYPGVYDDMTDTDLDIAVLAKHPEYQDLAEKQDQSTTPSQKSTEFQLKPEQYGVGEEQARRLKTLQEANAKPLSEPTTFSGGFAKSLGDFAKGGFGFSSEDFGSMLESAAHPRSLSDFVQLLIPGEVKAAGALNKLHEPVPSLPRGNIAKIAESVASESPSTENIRRNAPFGEGSIMPSEVLPTELRGPIAAEERYPVVNFREDIIPQDMPPEFSAVGEEARYNQSRLPERTPGVTEQQQYDLARNKFNQGRDLPPEPSSADLGRLESSVEEAHSVAPEMAVPEREGLFAGETGSFRFNDPRPAPVKPKYKLDTQSGMGIPVDEAGNQIGTAVGPAGQPIRPELAQASKYNQVGRLANEAQKKSLWGEFRDANRAILTAFDFSPLGRQGKPFLLNKEYYTSLDDMFKSWGSERAYQAVRESIESHPNFQRKQIPVVKADGTPVLDKVTGLPKMESSKVPSLAERAGLDLTNKEEMFQSNMAEKLVPGVRRSERAYNAFLSKLRADSFNRMVSDAEAAGMNPKTNDVLLKSFGQFINDATGRGGLGKLEKAAPVLNELFFAPRLMASRVNMYKRFLNPMTYSNENPILRKQTLKSLVSTVGFGVGVGELAKLAGAKVSNDPTSSDFRKIKIGDTRIDPFSGFQQYAVGASRLLSGELTSTSNKNYGRQFDLTTGKANMPSRRSVAENFFANKLAPVPSLIWSWMGGREFDGTPFEMKKAILNRTVPIVMQDLYEIYQEDPKLFPPGIFKQNPTATKIGMGALPIFGEGIQTYGR